MLLVIHPPGSWFNIKMSSYQYRKSHRGDKTVVRSSYLHNGISYTGKMISFYWIGRSTGVAYTTCINRTNCEYMTWICNYIYIKPWDVLLITNSPPAGVILCIRPANERRRYIALPGHIHKLIPAPCLIFNGGLTKQSLMLGHGYFPHQALGVVNLALISNTVNHLSKDRLVYFSPLSRVALLHLIKV